MSEKTETAKVSAELPPAPAPDPTPEPKSESKSETPKKTKKSACVQSPTREHDYFHNEGTDETYCRYCGKPQ